MSKDEVIIDADKEAAEAVTAEEKYAELPAEKKQEVDTLKDTLAAQNLGEMQATQEEKDVYYDNVSKQVTYQPVTEANNDPNKMRVGTIGPLDITKLPDVKVHLNNNLVEAYEVDDGEDNFDRAGLKADGYKIKRSFIDSSVYNLAGLNAYLQTKSIDENWYKIQSDNLIDKLHDEIKK